MTALTCYRTSDGAIHSSMQAAGKHADERFGKALQAVAHKLVRIEKHKDMLDFLERHVHELAELKALKSDMELEQPPQGDEEA